MNFKNIVWFIKAISYFVLLRSLGIIIIMIQSGCLFKISLKFLYKDHFVDQAIEFTLALSQALKITTYVTWDCSVFLFNVITD